MDLTGDVKRSTKDRGAELADVASVNRLADAPEGHRPQACMHISPSTKAIVSIGIGLGYAPIEDLPKHVRPSKRKKHGEATALAIFPCTSASYSL